MNVNSAILISDPINIRYLTGFMGLAPNEREVYCLLTGSETFLFVNSLYRETANSIVLRSQQNSNKQINKYTNNPIKIIELSQEKPIEILLNQILLKNNVKTLEFEKYDVSVAEYEKLQKELSAITLVPSFGKIEKMRIVKNKNEIDTIKKACALTDECFTHLLTYIKEGQSESEIAWEIETFFHENGATSSFSPIVAFNEHSSQPHYASAISCQLKAFSIILLDFGAKVDGYCADMTRIVFLGKPKDEWIKAYNTILEAQMAALKYLGAYTHLKGVKAHLPGVVQPSGAKADEIAKKIITDAGYPVYPHGLGHGVGLAIHEAPRLSMSRDETLVPGNVFSVEPGIYVEGKYGIRIEDLVVLTDTGAETLSKSEKGLILI
ncbi:aminopeptidase P family protein [Candidatus Gottesmanbacteria bacterium]|nr:aminopeptidase P family protein [Candidatus Gottesmanbacteria bacterium]